ncbi:TPA: hypothetical protein MDZ31_002099 [Klebsiella pneumoniae]|uniref:hypothetical protein n=1 Tax=Klebsiella pneumoniae TaxID=573 RepID=UPI001CD561B9|nr:hypothetical protein [Klebsiella pneumoniae]HBU7613578.1 hypothetical protein [Klebsiella pneumoniae]HBV2056197.1 hypothetical protein [Klebsiella pneumoniae]HBV4871603.1 hypothetical protein [Klebsiella pneumoniae]HBV7885761.1 hypothetical protein [Klebsiella pneumoniae]
MVDKVKTQSQNPKSKPKVKTSPFGASTPALPSRLIQRSYLGWLIINRQTSPSFLPSGTF